MNVVPINFGGLTAVDQRVADRLTRAAVVSSGPTYAEITGRNGRFFVHGVNGTETPWPAPYLDVVIADVRPGDIRSYWEKGYDQTTPSAPDCWSDLGVKPDGPAATRPKLASGQAVQSCAECPMNVPGTAASGQGKACRWKKHLVVYAPNDIGGTPLIMSLGSLSYGKKVAAPDGERSFTQYIQYLRDNSAVPGQLVTRINFNTHKSMTVTAYTFAPATENGNLIPLTADQQRALADALDSPEMKTLMEGAAPKLLGADGDSVAALPAPKAAPALAPTAAPKAAVVPPRPAVAVPSRTEARYKTADAALAARIETLGADEWALLRDWATHESTTEADVRGYMDEFYPQPVAVATPTPTPAPTAAPVARPGRPKKLVAEAAPPTPTPTPVGEQDDVKRMLGLTPDM